MHRLCLMLLALLAVGAVAAPAGAVSVEVQPDRVLDGDTVTIALADLPNGTVFSLRLEGAVAPRPDGTFAFTTTDLVMPFSLEQGQVQAALENTATNELVVRKGDTQAKMSGALRERPVRDRAERRDPGRHLRRDRPLGHRGPRREHGPRRARPDRGQARPGERDHLVRGPGASRRAR